MRRFRLMGFLLGGLVVACATADERTATAPNGNVLPGVDASVDGDAADSGAELTDAGPDPCMPNTFCPLPLFGLSDDLLPHNARIAVVRGRSASDVWAIGALGALAHFDGNRWTRQHVNPAYSLSGLWLRSDGILATSTPRIAFALDLQLEHYAPPATTADGWFRIAEPTGSLTTDRFTSMWTLPGAEWLWGTLLTVPTDAADNSFYDLMSGLWRAHVVDGRLELGAVLSSGECKIYRCQSMRGVHGASSDDLWAVGSSGAILHVTDAQSESPAYVPFNSRRLVDLFGVWAGASDDAWAVGASGTLLHYHDGVWEGVEQSFTNEHLYNVWGTSKDDVWAVGAKATVLHYDGVEWRPFPITALDGATPDLVTVWAADRGHVWIGGDNVLLALGGEP